jgi:hypothetical protein
MKGLMLTFALVFAMTSFGWAGLCLDDDTYCNDFWYAFAPGEAAVYEIHGYEYGCGDADKSSDGVMHIYGGYVYFGTVGAEGTLSGMGDYGDIVGQMTIIDLSTFTGPMDWEYFYSDAGTPAVYGGVSSITASPDPRSGQSFRGSSLRIATEIRVFLFNYSRHL